VAAKLYIEEQKTVQEIQQEFSRVFPYLKIEFFKRPHKKKELSPASDLAPHHLKVGLLMKKAAGGTVQLPGTKSVLQLEDEFEKKFGLHVQVFRHSGNLWIETNLTDHWSLERQNEEGYELSRPLRRQNGGDSFPAQETE
jgi:hypothetical protein